MAFIASCFASGSVPEATAASPRWEQSLSAYLGEHQVVAIVQQAVGACAAAQPAPENPLQFVGEYIQDRHVGGAVRPSATLPAAPLSCTRGSENHPPRFFFFSFGRWVFAGRRRLPGHGRG